MVKTLVFGFLLGIAGSVAAVYFLPAVDQYRESSIISVTPNGGNTESFHINIPMDRILVGAPDQPQPVPPGMVWPKIAELDGVRAELFKIRNSRDTVVGVASRIAASSQKLGDNIEWVLHLPARGSVYVTMPPRPIDGVHRVGTMRSGTREFETLTGQLTERWVANEKAEDEDVHAGRIELLATFVGRHSDDSLVGATEVAP